MHKLRIFATIARLGNFTRAAEVLHMTQPTVSQQIAVLETQLGTTLFERQTRRLRLTSAGAALQPYAEQILALADTAATATRAAAGLADRTLRLGVGHALATYLLPDLLRGYRDQQPDNTVRFSVGNTAELLELVASDAVELALVGTPAVLSGIEVVEFMRDRLVVIVAPDDPWASRSTIAIEELGKRILLTREAGSALHASVEQLVGAAALRSDNTILLGENEAIKRSVESGLGVALIQEIAVRREVATGMLVAVRLDGDAYRSYVYAYRRNQRLSAAALIFVELLSNISQRTVARAMEIEKAR